MILYRYLAKEVTLSLIAILAILISIFLCTQLVRYLSEAALGEMSSKILLHVMLLEIPYLLGLLLPLGFFLSLLLTYSRLHTDREMIAMASGGMSLAQLIYITLVMATVVACITTLFAFWWTPILTRWQKTLIFQAESAPVFETVIPGQFFSLNQGKNIFYVESTSADHKYLNNIFIADSTDTKNWNILRAKTGYSWHNPQTDANYFVLIDGTRYQGTPGKTGFQIQHFAKLDYELNPPVKNVPLKPEMLTTKTLWKQKTPIAVGELQWRVSLPLSAFILALLAVPLSYVNSRQGRYAQLLPAVLIYIFYANMIFVSRDWLAAGEISSYIGVWWLHLALFILSVILIIRQIYLRRV